MNTEHDPFELASRPPLSPPVDGWPQIAHALRKRQRRRLATVWLSTAAALTLAAGLAWQLPHFVTITPAPIEALPVVTAPVDSSADPEKSVLPEAVTAQDNLEALIELSQQLERNLRLVRAEIDAMPAQSVVYQDEREDLVAQVDDALNLKPDSRELWSQRVNLLLDLEQLYQRELRRDYSNVASL